MTPSEWNSVRWFRPEEFGEGADRIVGRLIYALDDLRAILGAPIVIHAEDIVAPRPSSPDSQHPLGRAIDCHAEGVPLLDFWLAAERISTFTGIGVYPYWPRPGLHLDVRPGQHRKRWWRDEAKRYGALDATVLRGLASRLA